MAERASSVAKRRLRPPLWLMPLVMVMVTISFSRAEKSSLSSALVSRQSALRYNVTTGCMLPARWQGAWFQSNVPNPIQVHPTTVDGKGLCVASNTAANMATNIAINTASGRKYLFLNEDTGCYKCVIFYEKHSNLLHYKESFCVHERDVAPSLSAVCRHVTGDRPLFALIRIDYRAMRCPLRGPLSFTYTLYDGHPQPPPPPQSPHPPAASLTSGELPDASCRSGEPLHSRLDVCNDGRRLAFTYRRCRRTAVGVDAASTEHELEQADCVAVWRDGSARYLITRRADVPLSQPQRAFRCSRYERAAPHERGQLDFRLSQADEPSCRGLLSSADGVRRLQLVTVAERRRCRFPGWLEPESGGDHWQSLDGRTSYRLGGNGSHLLGVERRHRHPHQHDQQHHGRHYRSQQRSSHHTGSLAMRLECSELVHQTADSVTVVVRNISGCGGAYQCLRLFRRSSNILELMLDARESSDGVTACRHHNRHHRHRSHNQHQLQSAHKHTLITLIAANSEAISCPHPGEYQVINERQISHDLEGTSSARDVTKNAAADWTTVQRNAPISDVHIGCRSDSVFVLISRSGAHTKAFRCRGGWHENGTHFMIASPVRQRARQSSHAEHLCFISHDGADSGGQLTAGRGILYMWTMFGACKKPAHAGRLVMNVTRLGGCRISSGNTVAARWSLSSFLLFFVIFQLKTA